MSRSPEHRRAGHRRGFLAALVAVLTLFIVAAAEAQWAALVRDIYDGTGGSSSPRGLTDVEGTLFFTASDPTRGRGLWRSDGTAPGTVVLEAVGDGFLEELVAVDGTLFFRTAHPTSPGHQLWRSDGTEAGTLMLKDFDDSDDGGVGGRVHNLVGMDGTLFFTVTYYAGVFNGLWKSDGTPAGTELVKSLPEYEPGPMSLTDVDGTLFFFVEHDIFTYDCQLWTSDGTASGTGLVSAGCGCGSDLTAVAGIAYFACGELWKSDGTVAGTLQVADIHPTGFSDPGELTATSPPPIQRPMTWWRSRAPPSSPPPTCYTGASSGGPTEPKPARPWFETSVPASRTPARSS